jgi:hypothetical protein
MSQESFLRERVAKLDTTADFLASLTGITATKLSQAFRGIRPLSGPDAETLNKTLSELDELVGLFSPVPIKLENATVIKELLSDLRDRRSTTAFCVRLDDRTWFAGRTAGRVQSAFSMLLAEAMDHLTASQVAEALKPSWPDVHIFRNPYASEDSIASEFTEVWNEKKTAADTALDHPFGPVQAR